MTKFNSTVNMWMDFDFKSNSAYSVFSLFPLLKMTKIII